MRRTMWIAAALAAGAAPAMARNAAELAANYASPLGQAQACGWLSAAEREALRLAADEQVMNAAVKDGETARAATQAALDEAKADGARKPCVADDKIRVQGFAAVTAKDWLIRSVAMLDAEQQPHAARFTTVGEHAAPLRAGYQAIVGQSGTDLYKKVRDAQAVAATRRVCPERRTVRWPSGQRPCPPPLADDEKHLASSRAFVAGVESFAALYAAGPSSPPAAASAHLFKAGPKHPLGRLSGKPLWQVYNDCSWAYFDELRKVQDDDAKAKAAKAAKPQAVVGSDAWMDGYAEEMAGMAALGKGMELVERGEAFTERAVVAYAAQTGKPRAESETFVKDAPAVTKLTTSQCAALR